MVELGVALLVVGAALLVAEAHVPGECSAWPAEWRSRRVPRSRSGPRAARVALVIGAILAASVVTGLWLAIATRKGLAVRRLRARPGARGSVAGPGVVRRWNGGDGQVFVDGALWRARPSWPDADEPAGRGRCGGGGARERADTRRAQSGGMGGPTVIEVILIVLWWPSCGAGAGGRSVRVLREYERGVVFRLGRVIDQKGPGLVLLVPAVDRMVRVSLRTVTLRIPPQEVITRDNVPVRVAAVAYFRVIDPTRSVLEVEDFRRDAPDRPDHAALGARQGRARLAAGRARAAQREPPADHRRADRALGDQGHDRRDQGRRDPRAMQHALARQAEAERTGAPR